MTKPASVQAYTVPLSELKQDPQNANLGTERGMIMLEASMEEVGFTEAGSVDRNGTIMSGNKRQIVAARALHADEALIIKHDGTRPIYLQNDAHDLNDPNTGARKAAYDANRVPEINLRWNADALKEDIATGLDLSGSFFPSEVDRIAAERKRPVEFEAIDIEETQYKCPKCGHGWNGRPVP